MPFSLFFMEEMLQLLRENNIMLKAICLHLSEHNKEESKEDIKDFISNIMANIYANKI